MRSATFICFLLVTTAQFRRTDARTFTGSIYANNWFRLYVNGKEVATDPVRFIPHNSVTFTFEDSKYKLYHLIQCSLRDSFIPQMLTNAHKSNGFMLWGKPGS